MNALAILAFGISYLLSFLLSGAHASALTTSIAANERLCFYADVDKAGEKIGVRVIKTHAFYLYFYIFLF